MARLQGKKVSARVKPSALKQSLVVGLGWIMTIVWACSVNATQPQTQTGQSGPKGATSGISIFCGGGAQFELEGPDGQRVLIDVNDPDMLSRPADGRDILLTTHFHFDHYHKQFTDSFPGEILQNRQGEIKRSGMRIQGIASQHTEHVWKQTGQPAVIDNFIFLIEMGGIRIAHFGDIGQKELTAEQLRLLGRIDIAITQFVNPYSKMDLENQKGYRLMDQLKPKIIIPHHGSANDDAIRMALERWRVVCAADNPLFLTKEALPARPTVLLMGEIRGYMQQTFDLKMWR